MSRKMLWLTVVALLIASLIPLVGVSAQTEVPYITLHSVDGQCEPGEYVLVTFTYGIPADQNVYLHYWTLTNQRTGTFTEITIGPLEPYDGTVAGYPVLPVPADTLPGDTLVLRVEVRQDFGEGYELVDADQISWNCAEPLPGCDVTIPIPTGAVVGAFVADALAYYEPGNLTNPLVTIGAENTAWVLGKDDSGAYYKIVWVCQYLWVEVGTMGPNYDEVWNGTPLPQGTVE